MHEIHGGTPDREVEVDAVDERDRLAAHGRAAARVGAARDHAQHEGEVDREARGVGKGRERELILGKW